ncbi:MAG: helix-turn-helix domain-containing protein [bacterium]|nr:helix-turn-helix domain-containing protein [bacterium]
MIFRKKTIVEQSIGEVLTQARNERNINLEKAARALKINADYLRALENNEFDKLPQGVYGRNFLREYCFLLKLNSQKMLDIYDFEEKKQPVAREERDAFRRQRVKKYEFLSLPKLIRNSLVIVVGLLFVGYLGLRVQAMVAPPELLIFFPPVNYSTDENSLEIKGLSEPDTIISVNGTEMLSNESGEFSYVVHLQQGVNIIKINSKKRYSQEAEIMRQVLVN